jgi:hypothetical protein
MSLENIDDLFRGKLDGHETPPGDDLWARLAAQPAAGPTASSPVPEAPSAERLDQLFQTRLTAHATPPARELWERLEDEHLRPRKRRAAAWWPMALAAAIALLITAGGAGLWLGFPGGKAGSDAVAGQRGNGPATAADQSALGMAATKGAASNPAATAGTTAPRAAATGASQEVLAANTAARNAGNAVSAPSQKNAAAWATRAVVVASSASKARKFAERQSVRHPLESTRQPDVAAPSPSLVARTTPAVAPAPARNLAADEQHPAPVVAAQTTAPVPAPEIVPTGTVITVDVRNGATPAARTLRTALSEVASAEETTERRGLGGRLLQQAGHLVRGERLSLAEATGLPENVTLRATIGGRRVSKSIQL